MPVSTYSAGTAFLTVVPSFRGVEKAMEEQVKAMAQKVDKSVAAALPRGMAAGAQASRGVGVKAAQQFTGAYEAEAKKLLGKAHDSLPTFDPELKLTKWQKGVNQIKADIREISQEKFGPDFDEKTFATAIGQMRQRLKDLNDEVPRAGGDRGFFDLAKAEGELTSLGDFVAQAQLRGREAADGFGGAFQQRMDQILSKGIGAIPKVKIDADTSDAERKLQGLRGDMETLASKTIGVDIDSDGAYAELRRISTELEILGRKRVEIEVRTNARAASADMAAFVAKSEDASKSVNNMGAASTFAITRLGALIGLGAAIGPAIIPGAAAASVAIGAIGTMAIGAATGLGVFALGLSGISGAVGAMNAYSEDQAKSQNNLNQANRKVAGSSDQVKMAELSLANTRANIADGEFDAQLRVADATRSVADARREAGERAEESNRRVTEAQRDVTDAEEDAVEVRRALNDAIRQATSDIAELDTALARNTQDQSKATTAQLEALEKLNALKANPRATEVELRKAVDAYNEQTVKLRELRDERKKLTSDQEQAAKLGVEGDERVIAVRKRIADADDKVARAKERREIAEEARTKQAEDSARRVEEAQRGVAAAKLAQDRQARDGAYQLAGATNSLESAQRTAQQSTEKLGVAGGAALDNLRTEMDKLSPAGQRFAKFIFGLKDEALALRDVAQENLLPGLQEAITILMPYLPGFSKFIGNVAGELGRLAIQTARAFENPTWQKFFAFVDSEAVPSLDQLFTTTMNFTEGLLSLFMALTPFNKPIGTGLVDMSADFAKWAAELDKSTGYQEFLEYVKENGPRVIHFLGEMGKLLIDLVTALAPVGEVALKGLTGLIDGINSIPIPVLTVLLFTIAGVSAAILGLAAVMKVVRFKRDIEGIFGPQKTAMVQTYAIETGRATKETGRFKTALATAAGFSASAGSKLSFLGDAADKARGGMAGAADIATGKYRQGMDVMSGVTGTARDKMTAFGESTRGTRNYLAYLGDDLKQATLAPAIGLVGSAAETAGRKVKGMGENVGAARNYLSYLADDLARGPLGPQFVAAGDAAQRFGDKVRTVGTKSITGMRNAAGALSGFMGGPWGVALAGATVAIGVLSNASADYNGKITTIAASLDELGKKYKELESAGKIGGPEATNLLLAIAESNPEMEKAIINLDAVGIGIGDLGKAAAGSKEDLDAVLSVLDQEIDVAGDKWRDESNFLFTVFSKDARQANDRLTQLRQLREAVAQHADELERTDKVKKAVNAQSAREIAMGLITKNNTTATTAEIAKMANAWDVNETKLGILNKTLANFGDNSEAAARRADDLTAAIDRQYGSAISANEATEKWAGNLISLRESVESNGTALDTNSRAGLANRDAIEAAAQAARDMFIEEVRAGGELPKVTAKHDKRIEALRKEADKLGLTKKETDKLIDTYGKIDENITTKYSTENFPKIFKEAQQLRFAQTMLELGVTDPEEAKGLWNKQSAILSGNYPQGSDYRLPGKATGGPIEGPGTGTSDDVLMWGSAGEHMLTAAEVKAAGGHEAIYQWRKTLLAGSQHLPGYKTGGEITKQGLPALAKGGKLTVPMILDFANIKLPTLKQALSKADEPGFDGSGAEGAALAGGSAANGWRAMTRIMKEAVPGTSVTSAVRSGGFGYHPKGRAIDMVFNDGSERRGGGKANKAFNYIASNYGKGTRELIWDFSPWGPSTGIWNGGRHRFQSATSGPGSHNDHLHWAFDNGGWMMPGMQGVNMLKQPEPVLTPGQWSVMEDFVKQGMVGGGSGNTYQLSFRDTTLNQQQLRDMQARDDALARVNRPR